MMSTGTAPDDRLIEEEGIVAELKALGVTYLSRGEAVVESTSRSPERLLADLMRQPSARVRGAVIALLLAHPEYAATVPSALGHLNRDAQVTLKLFYTAAFLLQQQHAEVLHSHLNARWLPLPDLFSEELGLLFEGSQRERLSLLGRTHRHISGADVNWAGTYENVARLLVRRWELERRWSR